MIESVDSLKLAAEIDRLCAAQQGKIMDILVEVNIAQEVSKMEFAAAAGRIA